MATKKAGKKHGRNQVTRRKEVKKVALAKRAKKVRKAARPVQMGVSEAKLLDLGDHFACKATLNPNRLDSQVLEHRLRETRADQLQILTAMGG